MCRSKKKAYTTSHVNGDSHNYSESEYILPTFYSQEEYEYYDNPMNNTPTSTASSAIMRSPLQLDIKPYFEEYHTHQSTPAEEEIGVTNAAVSKGEPRNTVHKKDNLWTSLSIDD